jgi:hypothetical protein
MPLSNCQKPGMGVGISSLSVVMPLSYRRALSADGFVALNWDEADRGPTWRLVPGPYGRSTLWLWCGIPRAIQHRC